VKDPLALEIPGLDESRSASSHSESPNGTGGNGARRLPAAAVIPQAPAQVRPRSATRGFNMLIWRGRLANSPEVREAPSGRRYLRIRCLQDQPDRNGQPAAQGIELALFDERADHFAAFFRKGDEVLVKGRLTVETKQDGSGFRTTVSVHPEGPIELLHRPQGSR